MSMTYRDILKTILKDTTNCDVRLIGSDGEVKAHRMILATASSFLYNTLIELGITNEEFPVIHIPDFSVQCIQQVISIIYNGSVIVTERQFTTMNNCANMLEINLNNVSVHTFPEKAHEMHYPEVNHNREIEAKYFPKVELKYYLEEEEKYHPEVEVESVEYVIPAISEWDMIKLQKSLLPKSRHEKQSKSNTLEMIQDYGTIYEPEPFYSEDPNIGVNEVIVGDVEPTQETPECVHNEDVRWEEYSTPDENQYRDNEMEYMIAIPPEPNYHKCRYCNKLFMTPKGLEQHEKYHKQTKSQTAMRRNRCCGKMFMTVEELRKHHKKAHKQDKVYGHIISRQKQLRKPKVKKVMQYQSNTNESNSDMATEETVSALQNYIQKSFEKSYTVNTEIHDNSKINDQDKVDCEVCGKTLSKKTINHHMYSHANIKRFTCSLCDETFVTPSKRYRHMINHRVKESRAYVKNPRKISRVPKKLCVYCGKEFRRVKAHIRAVHRGEKRCVCKICGMAFKWSSSLSHHMGVHSKEIFPCTECPKEFPTHSHLQIHMKQTHALRIYLERKGPVTCDFCKKEFSTPAKLTQHKHSQHQIPRKCRFCKLEFMKKSAYFKHIRKHESSEKIVNYPCRYCNETFESERSVVLHLKQHHIRDALKVYEDPQGNTRKSSRNPNGYTRSNRSLVFCYCGDIFNSSIALTSHKEIHSGHSEPEENSTDDDTVNPLLIVEVE